jgi:carboxypeptidase Taq
LIVLGREKGVTALESSMKDKLDRLRALLVEIDDIQSAAALLHWDQLTYMPPCGGPARARQRATLARIAHEKFIEPLIGKLLDELLPYEESLPYDSDEASLLRVTRREYERAVKVPPEFTARLFSHNAQSYDRWVEARLEADFRVVEPFLKRTVELSREFADFFSGYEHICDPLIDFADHGMKVSTVRRVFSELRQELVPMVEAIASQQPADDTCLKQSFPEKEQIDFARDIVERFGYDFSRGRLDKTAHPFSTKFSLGDVRITTRTKKDDLTEQITSTMHEAGHAMYEQGINQKYEGTPLAVGTSSGVHESQSRLWENLVGRSRAFWNFFYPKLQITFPNQLGSVSLDTFYRAFNKVERSLIRTEADEVTYNLHVVIRFDLELQLLEGELAAKDLKEAWNERYESDLSISSTDDCDGVLQDVHWYGGMVGGSFQGYTLGNILGAQFFDAALEAHPEIPSEIERGRFETLYNWLKNNVCQHGRKYTASELVERVTGGPLDVKPFVNYLRNKYRELYEL